MNFSLVSFLLVLFCVSAVFAQDPTDPSPNTCIGGACMASLYEQRALSDLSGQVIHLDRVFSQFENSWLQEHPGYYYQVLSGNGHLYQVTATGGKGAPLSSGRVTDDQGLVWYEPTASGVEGSDVIYFAMVDSATNQPAGECKLVVDRYTNCATVLPIHDGAGNTVYSPAVPEARITYDRDNQNFDLSVAAAYIADDATWMVDFADFGTHDNIRLRQGCSNQPARGSTDPFNRMWSSAPHSAFPKALNTAYPAYMTNSDWTMGNRGECGTVEYNTTYSFSTLMNCKDGSDFSVSSSVQEIDGEQQLVYQGSLYVNALAPLDQEHEEWGLSKFRHVYPFKFGFRQRITAIVGIPTEQALRVFIREAKLDVDGFIYFAVETHYATPQGLYNPLVDQVLTVKPAGIAAPCSGANDVCIQEWVYEKLAGPWAEADNDKDYKFTWQVIADDHTVGVTITIKQRLQETQGETGLDIGSLDLRVFNNENNMVQGVQDVDLDSYVFDPRERVYIRADLVVPNADVFNFGLAVKNVYVCYSRIEGYEIEYVEGQKQGCLDPFVLASERFQIINEGSLISADPNVLEFAATHEPDNTVWANPAGMASDGFSYLATPQLPTGRIYTVHIEADITQIGAPGNLAPSAKRSTIEGISGPTDEYVRSVHFVTQTHSLRDVDVENGSLGTLSFRLGEPSDEPKDSGFSPVMAAVIGVCVLAGCTVLAAAFFLIRRFRRNQVEVVGALPTGDELDL